jgi:hypothetical protein
VKYLGLSIEPDCKTLKAIEEAAPVVPVEVVPASQDDLF